MKTILTILTLGALLALPLGAAFADQPPRQANRPSNGMTMQKVQSVFGQPAEKIPAVGDPPIARWIYPHYVVYFEDNLVLHTVSKDKPFHDAPPASKVRHIVSGQQD